MTINALVWGENIHEQTNADVHALYPDGMHALIAEVLGRDGNISATTATLQESEHGLCRGVGENRCIAVVGARRAR